jgi:hypothetical protein
LKEASKLRLPTPDSRPPNYDLPFVASGKDRPLRFTVFGNNLLNRQPEETIIGSVNRLVGREFFAQMEMRF